MSVELTVVESIIYNEERLMDNQRGVRILYPHGSERLANGCEITNYTGLTIGFRIENNRMILATTGSREILDDWEQYRTVSITLPVMVDPELEHSIDVVADRYMQVYRIGAQQARAFASADFFIHQQ